MLKGTSHKPDEIVGTMRPSPPHEAWEFNVEMVAANAVMAGAKPEYLPVILAVASTGVTSLFSSTTSFARMMVVNGPIIDEIGMNGGIGAMSPLNKANSTIGRAWTLLSRNLGGGAIPGQTYLGSQGNISNYNNICFPEREEKLPAGWKPFSEQKGFKHGESAVSTLTGWDVVHGGGRNKEALARSISRFVSGQYRQITLLLDPIVANDFKDFEGFQTKEALTDWLIKNTPTPSQGYWTRHPEDRQKAKSGVEPFATWLKYPEGALIPVTSLSPEVPVEIIVVGGETNAFMQVGDFRHVSTASVDKWR
jgi:hypothetical protein